MAMAHTGIAPRLSGPSRTPSTSAYGTQWLCRSARLSGSSRVAIMPARLSHSLQADESFAQATRQWCSRQQSSRGLVCRAMDASIGGSEPAQPVFPRLNVRDPFKRLGVSKDASEEEIREARNYLSAQYGGHEQSRQSIEAAYDKIIMESFRDRKKSKMNLKSDMKKKVAELPAWVRNMTNMFDVPNPTVIAKRAAVFAFLGVWSVFSPGEGGPAFQVAVSFAACVYFLNDRLKSIGRAFLLGFAALVIGWVFGSFLVPVIPTQILPRSWTLELTTSLISYGFLWFACTYLK